MRMLRFFCVLCIGLAMLSCTPSEERALSETSPEPCSTSSALTEEKEPFPEPLDIPTFSEEELRAIASFEGTLSELETQFPSTYADIVNCTPFGEMSNIVGFRHYVYYGTGKVLVASYDFQVRTRTSAEFYPLQHPKAYFESLSACSTLEEVRALDPKGEYIETGAWYSDSASYHYTTDGYVIAVLYQDGDVFRISVHTLGSEGDRVEP
ncbi:MAG: hypothetical protein IKC69_01575 [Clostridia bacterium]|nr:hypothetical protein [Clostridia bacterium]